MEIPELSPEIQQRVVGYAVNVASVIFLLIAVWVLSRWARGMTLRALTRAKFDVTLTKFFGNLARWAILLMGVLSAMSIFGIQQTSFAAVLGGAGLAIGMAFSGTLGNFAAGIMLLVFRPFDVGDVVQAAGVIGKVDEIQLFTTTLDTPDNRRLIIPNSLISGATIENVTHHETRRVDVAVGTDYTADVDRTRQVLEQAAKGVPGRLADQDVHVVLCELGASSVDWQIRLWAKTADYFAVKDACIREVKLALDRADIGIPFPQMDVHFDRPKVEA